MKRFAFTASITSTVAIATADASVFFFDMSIQMEVIKKAYHQESECEGVEVSPREVGHNIYILAQQVRPVCSQEQSANRHTGVTLGSESKKCAHC